MDRDVARAKREHLPDGIGKAFLIVVGQTRDEVHVDIIESGADRLVEGLDGLPGRMAAADGREDLVGHGLGVDGDARGAAGFDHAQLFLVQRVGAAALDREFQTAGKIEARVDGLQQLRHLRARERRRRAAADVERADVETGIPQQLTGMRDLAQQRVQIRRQKLPEALDGLAHERAVRAARRAERDPDIYRKIVRVKQLRGLDGMPRGVDAELCPRRRDKIGLAQQALGVFFAAAAGKAAGRKLRRPHAGERAPRGRGVQHLHGREIVAALQDAPCRAHVGILQPHAVGGEAGPAAIGDLGGRREELFAAREGRDGPVAGERLRAEFARLLREQLQLQLLDGVALGVVFQIQLHPAKPPRR